MPEHNTFAVQPADMIETDAVIEIDGITASRWSADVLFLGWHRVSNKALAPLLYVEIFDDKERLAATHLKTLRYINHQLAFGPLEIKLMSKPDKTGSMTIWINIIWRDGSQERFKAITPKRTARALNEKRRPRKTTHRPQG